MGDEAKLGLVAGVLAVVGVAVFGLPKAEPPKPETALKAPAPAEKVANSIPAIPEPR